MRHIYYLMLENLKLADGIFGKLNKNCFSGLEKVGFEYGLDVKNDVCGTS